MKNFILRIEYEDDGECEANGPLLHWEDWDELEDVKKRAKILMAQGAKVSIYIILS